MYLDRLINSLPAVTIATRNWLPTIKMPKNSKTVAQRATSFVNTFKRDGIKADGVKLICRTCGPFLGDGSIMKSQIDQHVKSKKHTENVKSQKNQVRIDQDNPKPYLRDLCKVSVYIFWRNVIQKL